MKATTSQATSCAGQALSQLYSQNNRPGRTKNPLLSTVDIALSIQLVSAAMRLYLTVTLAVFLCSCSAQTIHSNACGGSAGTYYVPKGWEVRQADQPSWVDNMIQEIGYFSRNDPSITINAYCRFDDRYPHTQQGCAESYLEGIHDMSDDNVKLDILDSVTNRHHGNTKIYRFYSEWFGDHLVSMVVTKSGYATVELWADSYEQRKKHSKTFQEVVQGIKLNTPKKSSLPTPAT